MPPGYDDSDQRYPVVYHHGGSVAGPSGQIALALDNLIADPRFENATPATEKTPEETELTTYVLSVRVTYHPSEETP